MAFHHLMTPTVGGIHGVVAQWLVDDAERLALSLVAEDQGKIVHQSFDNTLWFLLDWTGPVWEQVAIGPSTSPFEKVPFDATTTSLILGAIHTGDVVQFGQVSVLTAFGAGTTIQFGTTGNLTMFLDVVGEVTCAYRTDESILIGADDFLVLTVSAVGGSGIGRLFYEVQ